MATSNVRGDAPKNKLVDALNGADASLAEASETSPDDTDLPDAAPRLAEVPLQTAGDDVDGEDVLDGGDIEPQTLLSKSLFDESLYSYDLVAFRLDEEVTQKAADSLLDKIADFLEKVTTRAAAGEGLRRKKEIYVREDLLPDEIKKGLRDGTLEIVQGKNESNAFFMQIRTAVKGVVIGDKEYGLHRKVKDVLVGEREVPADVMGSIQCLAQQRKLDSIARDIGVLTEACETGFDKVIQGQQDDRLAKIISARNSFIQGLLMSDRESQRIMLTEALSRSNDARAELAFQIRSDIDTLSAPGRMSSVRMERTVAGIGTAIGAMNTAVELSLYACQALGQSETQKAIVADHRAFVKQILLKKITHQGISQTAWQVVTSSQDGSRAQTVSATLPEALVLKYDDFLSPVSVPLYLEGSNND